MAFAALLALLLAPPSLGAGPARPVAVVDTSPPGTDAAHRRAVLELLRLETAESRTFAWTPPPALGVDELLVALGCESMDEACMRRAAAHLKVDALGTVDLDRAGTRARVRVLQVAAGTRVREALHSVPRSAAEQASLRTVWRDLLHAGVSGKLSVQSDPAGATVEVNGRPAGTTPADVGTLPPGPNLVRISLAGHTTQQTTVEIVAGESRSVHVPLQKAAAQPVARPAEPVVRPAGTVAPAPPPAAPAQSRAGLLALLGGGGLVSVAALAAVLLAAGSGALAGGVLAESQRPGNVFLGKGLGTVVVTTVYGGVAGAVVLGLAGLVLGGVAVVLLGAGAFLWLR
ncbi:MAG: PEGA domain-containing protein [Deltaproteobacteria bacterium]|nr:PEGA domain-containing protein [Deltaproteobacteria bacterium]